MVALVMTGGAFSGRAHVRVTRHTLACDVEARAVDRRDGSGENLVFTPGRWTIGRFSRGDAVMEWRIKLEARSGWRGVETFKVASFKRCVVGLTAEEIGLSLEEAKQILAELQRRVLQTQMEEYTYCARACSACLKMRRQRACRTRTIQTLFGKVTVEAPRISICPCSNTRGFVDLSFSSLADLLPDRCTPEFRRLQADLGARHSFREAGRILSQLLPCAPANHATIRNRTHRVAADMEAPSNVGRAVPSVSSKETVVMIDGARIRAVPGHQSRHLDVTVGKVEVAGRKPRRFAFAPKGADRPLDVLRAALGEQGWRPGQKVTVISAGEALPTTSISITL